MANQYAPHSAQANMPEPTMPPSMVTDDMVANAASQLAAHRQAITQKFTAMDQAARGGEQVYGAHPSSIC